MSMSAETPYTQVYTSLEEIGLTTGTEALLSIAESLPNNSVIQYHVDGTYNVTEYPYTNGDFKAIKSRDAVMFMFSNDDLLKIWNRIAFYYSNEEGSPDEWYIASSWEWGDRTPYLFLPLPNPNMFDNTSEYISEISLKLDETIKRIIEDSSEFDNYYNKQQVDGLLGSKADASNLTSHINNKSNPHNVTKTQLGIGNVDNTTDMAKPVSTAMQTALAKKSDTNHTHNYLPLTGGRITGTTTYGGSFTGATIKASSSGYGNPAIHGLEFGGGRFLFEGASLANFEYVEANKRGFMFSAGQNALYSTSTAMLGHSYFRWSELYLANQPNVSSDRNLKDNIRILSNRKNLDFINLLSPVSFSMKDDDENKNHLGFVAQDVLAACNVLGINHTGFISYEENPKTEEKENMGLAYTELIAPLVGAIKELTQRLATAEKMITTLQSRTE